ncbi:MAG: anaerobic ribonucleoside-triphosphate reductase activating protein [Clostridia bacterium]|nr:anaerobic ribonucleoside-triphosphate reductase activating protein [Clostridia bacterium]MCI8964922.1 anaerobic ribonucleoside-triphosphate reductase activating protein [Clostridia bacterium]
MNYADIKKVDVANGEGIRVSVFVSGCNHHCEGCFNKCAWDFNYGNKFTEKNINEVINYLDHEHISGLSLLGGEPLEYANQEGLLPLVKKVKEKFPSKNIWCYTGFDFEKDVVKNMARNNETTKELLNYLDVVVDGKFEKDKKNLKLKFRGSTNQRIIDVKESLKENKVVQIDRLTKY